MLDSAGVGETTKSVREMFDELLRPVDNRHYAERICFYPKLFPHSNKSFPQIQTHISFDDMQLYAAGNDLI